MKLDEIKAYTKPFVYRNHGMLPMLSIFGSLFLGGVTVALFGSEWMISTLVFLVLGGIFTMSVKQYNIERFWDKEKEIYESLHAYDSDELAAFLDEIGEAHAAAPIVMKRIARA